MTRNSDSRRTLYIHHLYIWLSIFQILVTRGSMPLFNILRTLFPWAEWDLPSKVDLNLIFGLFYWNCPTELGEVPRCDLRLFFCRRAGLNWFWSNLRLHFRRWICRGKRRRVLQSQLLPSIDMWGGWGNVRENFKLNLFVFRLILDGKSVFCMSTCKFDFSWWFPSHLKPSPLGWSQGSKHCRLSPLLGGITPNQKTGRTQKNGQIVKD